MLVALLPSLVISPRQRNSTTDTLIIGCDTDERPRQARQELDSQISMLRAAAIAILLPLILDEPRVTRSEYEQACTFSPRVLTIQRNMIIRAVPGDLRRGERLGLVQIGRKVTE